MQKKTLRILLALGNPSDTGGPTKYAKTLKKELQALGHSATLISFSGWSWKLPTGIRHAVYAAKLFMGALRSDVVLAFDTATVGIPALMVRKVTRTPLVIRIGGDFLWEAYVERTGDLVKFSHFYQETRGRWSTKESIVFWWTKRVVKAADLLFFNSDFQKNIWQPVYGFVQARKLENLYPPREEGTLPQGRSLVCAGREMKLKQTEKVQRIVADLSAQYPDLSLDTRNLSAEEHQRRVSASWAVIVSSVSEMSPNAIIDAVKYGKPFICTADTGIRERLLGVGRFIDTQNDDEMHKAIEELCDPALYAEAVEKVKSFTMIRSWKDITNDVLQAIEEVCK